MEFVARDASGIKRPKIYFSGVSYYRYTDDFNLLKFKFKRTDSAPFSHLNLVILSAESMM